MSIILKALKSAGDDKDDKEELLEEPKKPGEGFFKGRGDGEKKSSPINLSFLNRRAYILAALLVVAVVFVVTLRFIRKGPEVHKVPASDSVAKPADTAPAPDIHADTLQPLNIQGIIDQADSAFNSGDYNKSADLFKQAVDMKPDDAYLHNSLGLVYQKKGLYSNAAAEYQKALELDDNCAECFNNLGLLKSVLGESAEARKYFEKALSLSGSYPNPYFNMAVLYEKEGDIGNAVKYYRQFIDLNPDKDGNVAIKVERRINALTGK